MNQVTLFSTCLGEEFFPGVIGAATTVLNRLGLEVDVRQEAFCCGQSAFNEGMRRNAVELAARFLDTHKPGIPIVIPSGSCTSMIKVFFPDLLADEPVLLEKARELIPWVHEFSEFLVNVLEVTDVGGVVSPSGDLPSVMPSAARASRRGTPAHTAAKTCAG